MPSWLFNEGPKWLFMFLWLGANIGLYFGFHYKFELGIRYYYTRKILGSALAVARGSAACLNFNCMLILIPVCRNLISMMRGSCRCTPRSIRRILDKNLTFHKLVAWAIVFFTALHTGSHMFNYLFYLSASTKEVAPGILLMSTVPDRLNFLSDTDTDGIKVMFTTVAGITGHVIIIVLFLMVTSSIEVMRRSYFEVFWYTHHLFVIFFGCLIAHGVQGLVRGQTNPATYNPLSFDNSTQDPKVCYAFHARDYRDLSDYNVSLLQTKEQQDLLGVYCADRNATVAAGGPQTWKWVVGPLFLYFLERIVRFYRSCQQVVVTKVVEHPSKVLEIQLKKRGFHAEAGQYVFVNAPEVRFFEWHPFTLTSSPEEDYFSVHIRLMGDWTEKMAKRCGMGVKGTEFKQTYEMPKILIDGPFGTPSEDIFKHEVGIGIGAGIGVTPFASILKSLWYQSLDPHTTMKLKKVYFFWICPDTGAFEWFQSLLQHLEEQMLERGTTDFLEYHIYLTRGWDPKMAREIYMKEDEEGDIITGLQQKTNYGRPHWDNIFAELGRRHPGVDMGSCPAYCTRNAVSDNCIQMLLALMELASSTIKKTFKNVLCGGVKCEVLSVLQSELLR
eukprot:m.124702 g.124702  ORF g.124702 m.124702 type:complete len:614 (+) comp37853_c0_seq2:60-1901(+)